MARGRVAKWLPGLYYDPATDHETEEHPLKFTLTAEQEAAARYVLNGDHTKMIAYAGAAKTTSLVVIGDKLKGEVGKYLSFNTTIAKQASQVFAKWIECRTTHSLAFQAVGKMYVNAGRVIPDKNNRRLRTYEVAKILKVGDGYRGATAKVSRNGITYMALQTVTRFCYSADDEIGLQHFPWNRNMALWTEQELGEVKALVVHFAQRAWVDIMDINGVLSYEHDYYLKQYQLSRPKILVDFLMIDEGQDTNPATLDIFVRQGDHAQLIMVGDSYQQIYAWRGAIDALDAFDAPNVAYLTKSFRFGEAIAVEANKWLTLLGAPHPLVGFEQIDSVVKHLADPRAVLCRTNAQVIAETLHYQEEGKKVYVQGGTKDIKDLATAAQQLMMGQPVEHAELIGFDNWDEVVEYANGDESAKDLRIFVKLVDQYGVEKILALASTTVSKAEYSDVITSTAHKAKGMEYESVRIGPDFTEPEPDKETGEIKINDAEGKLAYVAVTRAKEELDCESLAWVDNWLKKPEPLEFPPLTAKVDDNGVEVKDA